MTTVISKKPTDFADELSSVHLFLSIVEATAAVLRSAPTLSRFWSVRLCSSGGSGEMRIHQNCQAGAWNALLVETGTDT